MVTEVMWRRGSFFLLADARLCPLLPPVHRILPTAGLQPVPAQVHQSCDSACRCRPRAAEVFRLSSRLARATPLPAQLSLAPLLCSTGAAAAASCRSTLGFFTPENPTCLAAEQTGTNFASDCRSPAGTLRPGLNCASFQHPSKLVWRLQSLWRLQRLWRLQSLCSGVLYVAASDHGSCLCSEAVLLLRGGAAARQGAPHRKSAAWDHARLADLLIVQNALDANSYFLFSVLSVPLSSIWSQLAARWVAELGAVWCGRGRRQVCGARDFWFINTCEVLAAAFPCQAGCSLELGPDVPCYVEDPRRDTHHMCLVGYSEPAHAHSPRAPLLPPPPPPHPRGRPHTLSFPEAIGLLRLPALVMQNAVNSIFAESSWGCVVSARMRSTAGDLQISAGRGGRHLPGVMPKPHPGVMLKPPPGVMSKPHLGMMSRPQPSSVLRR